MRLLTWNLSDLDVTAPGLVEDPRVAVLAAARADVVCLQKVSGEVEPTGTEGGLALLADHLGMTGVLGRAAGDRLHVAVLWGPVWTSVGEPRPRDPSTHRNQLVVDLVSDATRLRVGCVHLPVTSVEDQLHDLDLLLAQTDDATLLTGDWNATGADTTYDARALEGDDRRVALRLDAAGLVDAAVATDAPWVPTWRTPDSEPFVRIDAFRLAPGVVSGLAGYRVLTAHDELSLHRPVEIELSVASAPVPAAAPR